MAAKVVTASPGQPSHRCGFTNTDLVLTNDDGRVLIVRNYDEAFRMAAAAPEQERTGIVAQHTLNLDPSVLWDVHEVVARNDRILSLVVSRRKINGESMANF